MSWRIFALFGVMLLVSVVEVQAQNEAQAQNAEAGSGMKLLEVRKIWDQGTHNAFTGLARFQDRWYCSFREGEGHASFDGSTRILVSDDGINWTSAGLLSVPNTDVRDPKLSVSPDGRLVVNCGAAQQTGPSKRDRSTASLVWTSKDGKTWDGPVEPVEPGVWLWRVTWQGDKAYGAGYQREPFGLHLYRSDDGVHYEKVLPNLVKDHYPNETSIVFQPDGTAVCIVRREAGPKTALLGTANAPYEQWEWKDLGRRLGGPALIQLPDGRFIAGGRGKNSTGTITELLWLDIDNGTLAPGLVLPSGGKDTSYPSFVWHDGLLWVSYYASHEGKTSVYLAKVDISPDTSGIAAPAASIKTDEQ